MSVRITSKVKQPRTVVVKVPGPQGSAGTANIGTVTVLNPDQNPTITASGTEVDRVYNYGLPRAPAVSVGTVTALDPDETPTITATTTDGDVAYNFGLPSAASFTVTDTTVSPNVAPSVATTVTDGDVALDFSLPRTAIVSVGTTTVVNPDQNPASFSTTNGSGDVTVDFDLPRAPAVTVGAVTPVDPDVDPSVTAVTTDGDVAFDFDLPTAAQFTVDPANVVNPDQNPAVSSSEEYGDYTLTFDLPRAPDFTVGTVTAVDQGSEAVTDVGTNGDVVLDFDLPKGDKGDKGDTGDTGAGVPDPIGSEGQIIVVSGGVTVWDDPPSTTDDISEGSNLYYTDARVDAVIATSDTDDLSEGATNLYYTDARVEAVAAPLYFTENVQTGNYTLALSDVAKVVAMNNSSAATVTVPPNSSVAFPVGTVVNVYAMTANAVTISEGSGVTVRNVGAIADQYVEVSLRKRATDEWVLSGNVA